MAFALGCAPASTPPAVEIGPTSDSATAPVASVRSPDLDRTAFEPRVERDEYARISRIWLSAANGDGTDLLRTAIGEFALESSGSNQSAAA